MQSVSDRLLSEIRVERRRLSRRRLLSGAAMLAGALALSAGALRPLPGLAQSTTPIGGSGMTTNAPSLMTSKCSTTP